ncbi:MAG: hypothetical protein IMZ52_01070 [Actinobacteria bacterium]|nr:hypothetical protein [Actinomycetota bacterium]MBE3114729.1 hypothetical protein [Actinomycetota bacterium]
MKYDEICNLLKEKGFRRISVEGAKKSSFVNKDYSVSVIVEENQTELTEEQIKMIKKRMKDLGYLSDD